MLVNFHESFLKLKLRWKCGELKVGKLRETEKWQICPPLGWWWVALLCFVLLWWVKIQMYFFPTCRKSFTTQFSWLKLRNVRSAGICSFTAQVFLPPFLPWFFEVWFQLQAAVTFESKFWLRAKGVGKSLQWCWAWLKFLQVGLVWIKVSNRSMASAFSPSCFRCWSPKEETDLETFAQAHLLLLFGCLFLKKESLNMCLHTRDRQVNFGSSLFLTTV